MLTRTRAAMGIARLTRSDVTALMAVWAALSHFTPALAAASGSRCLSSLAAHVHVSSFGSFRSGRIIGMAGRRTGGSVAERPAAAATPSSTANTVVIMAPLPNGRRLCLPSRRGNEKTVPGKGALRLPPGVKAPNLHLPLFRVGCARWRGQPEEADQVQ